MIAAIPRIVKMEHKMKITKTMEISIDVEPDNNGLCRDCQFFDSRLDTDGPYQDFCRLYKDKEGYLIELHNNQRCPQCLHGIGVAK